MSATVLRFSGRLAHLATGGVSAVAIGLITAVAAPPEAAQATPSCSAANTVSADVVALDQLFFFNRYGAHNPGGMMFALRRDVVDGAGHSEAEGGTLTPGNVMLRPDKRPRPLVLRVNEGECLQIHFQNLLAPAPVDNEQPATRTASVHVMGMSYVDGPATGDGAFVGNNANSLVAPGGSATYTVYGEREGTHLLYSAAATTGGEGNGGSLAMGLFGAVNVEPANAEWYRSQLTREELDWASLGTLPSGHPDLDYDAVYPVGHRFAGEPILAMRHNGEIIHSDLTAVITGDARGHWAPGTFTDNPVFEPNRYQPQALGLPLRDRTEPFREFTVIFHDEIFAIQAFDEFEDEVGGLAHTLHGVRDGFAINYGTGGLGAELLANRKGVGPVAGCNECKYEEFFLTSWAVGDPAMIVDVPAGAQDPGDPLDRATTAFYPNDPSNVYHSYLGDRVKMRNLHAGPAEHHIFHLHAHQWLFTPDSDTSSYLDSQAIGPGANYTYEIVYNGSGNRNQTVGDSIFHCHLYPHFAQGMWSLWRVHDVFEQGTELDGDGRVVAGARALPDGEIKAGTPIPAVVPMPTLAMAPLPGAVEIVDGDIVADDTTNPGYPFFIPGRAGHRPPQPPLELVEDGGLPRHVVIDGETAFPAPNRLDYSKENVTLAAEWLDQNGTALEQTAMAFHAERTHPTYTPEGQVAHFVTNGQPGVAGAPYADPCVDDFGSSTVLPDDSNLRTYAAAAFELDIVLNKTGTHFPQSRILALWDDVQPTLDRTKAPEPFFFRANSGDCINYYLTNLLPHVYELDDFQVRTPTDTVGQHIHLVKFDVTSSDGSGNGYNYEDGSFSPGEVIERIAAVREGIAEGLPGATVPPGKTLADFVAQPHSFFGAALGLGAQTTTQRWYADPVTTLGGTDRTLRTVFTHDHFAPSTQQQTGYYAGLLIEPAGSTWRDPETGVAMGGRADGGPTSWRADIIPPDVDESFREFVLAFSDFQLAYEANGGVDGGGNPIPDPARAINPPGRETVGLPKLLNKPNVCGETALPPPCPEAISADDPGMFSVNYRNEPIAERVYDPASGKQAKGKAGDLAWAFRTDIERANPLLNQQPSVYPPLTGGVQPQDPFTPLMRAYQGDLLDIRMLTGGQEEGHIVNLHGLKWQLETETRNSGWRNAQVMGISEHFEMRAPIVKLEGAIEPFADYMWTIDASSDGFWNGTWGLLRAYDEQQGDLLELPSNPVGPAGVFAGIQNRASFNGVCPQSAPLRTYNVSAVRAADVLPGGTLVYNDRTGAFGGRPGPLNDPTGLMYVLDDDINLSTGKLKASAPVEPLVLRAAAGECIQVTLTNRFSANPLKKNGFFALPMVIENFNANDLKPSQYVGLHPQLVAYDVTRSNGVNVGLNAGTTNQGKLISQTPRRGQTEIYQWYAGDVREVEDGLLVATPVEFGATNLMPADPILHPNKGLVGALIIEPEGATWTTDPGSRASATVTKPGGGSFREFVVVNQTGVNLRDAQGRPICPVEGGTPCTGAEDAEDSGNKAINYRTEPLWFRMGYNPGTILGKTRTKDFTDVLSNGKVGGDPQTPVFTAQAGQEVRFRVLNPGGPARNQVFQVHGHGWQRTPYQTTGDVGSDVIGDNPLAQVYGAQSGHGPGNHFDVVLNGGAGGWFNQPGDYLYRDQASFGFDAGLWGILRVTE